MKIRNIPILLAIAAVLTGCGDGESGNSVASAGGTALDGTPSAVAKAIKDGTPVDPAIVAADNTLGLNLLHTLLAQGGGENIAISPLSVSLGLQVLYNGAGGTTRTDMAKTLALGGLTVSALNDDNAALQASLTDADPAVQLTIANSLWTDGTVLEAFKQTDQNYYGAKLGDLTGAPDNVNTWVSAETQGLITNLMPPGRYTGAIIANVLYFKGQWTSVFEPSQTAAGPFTLSDGSQVSAQLMHQQGIFELATGTLHGTSFEALRLPYGSGRLGMLFILPGDASTDLSSFVSTLTSQDLSSMTAQLHSSFVDILIPRFKATYASSLKPALTSLGMGSAFLPTANFSALSPEFYVNTLVHQTVVEVDEQGTVAAAATGVAQITAVGETVAFNRPFLYAIEDEQTGELLFVGVLMNPN